MLVPTVAIAAGASVTVASVQKLSVLGFVNAAFSAEQLEQLAPPSVTDAAKSAVLAARSFVGPFTPDMMAAAASWLDQGARKVVVNAASSDESALEAAAIAVSELPASRVVLRVPVTSTTEAEALKTLETKLQKLHECVGGIILAVGADDDKEKAAAAAASTFDSLVAVRKLFKDDVEGGFLVGVEWEKATPSLETVAKLHHKAISVVSASLEADAPLAFVKCLRTDRPDGLFTTVVADHAGVALGLVYSSEESVLAAIESGRGVYFSRSRGGLWKKGESSGNAQTLVQLDMDCDSDALRFTVDQTGAGFCHLNTRTCWGEASGLRALQSMLASRFEQAPEGSYTKRLFNDPQLLRNKLVEEAQELAEAETVPDVAGEAADVFYFAMVRCVAAGATLEDVEVRFRS